MPILKFLKRRKGSQSTDQEDDNKYTRETWGECSRSDCGYADSVHDTLMSIGKLVHSCFGEPSSMIQDHMDEIGDYFQEASYSARDYHSGNANEDDFSILDTTTMLCPDYYMCTYYMGNMRSTLYYQCSQQKIVATNSESAERLSDDKIGSNVACGM